MYAKDVKEALLLVKNLENEKNTKKVEFILRKIPGGFLLA